MLRNDLPRFTCFFLSVGGKKKAEQHIMLITAIIRAYSIILCQLQFYKSEWCT